MSINIHINNIYSKIIGNLSPYVHKQLYDVLSYKHQNSHYIKKSGWDGVYRLYYKNRQEFYTGLFPFVKNVLKENNISYGIIDSRVKPEKNLLDLKFKFSENYTERDYQTFAVNRAFKFTRGILEMATGSGKTLTAIRLISEIKTVPFIFYVLSIDLLYQAYEEMLKYLNVPIGIIGDGKLDIQNINVCTIQTAVRAINHFTDSSDKFNINEYFYDDEDIWGEENISSQKASLIKNLLLKTKGLIIDECHHVAAKTIIDVLKFSPNAYWRYGCSATPYRDSGDEILLQGMLGSKIVSINASFLIKNNFLLKPYIFFVPTSYNSIYNNYMKVYSDCVSNNNDFNNHIAKTAISLMSLGLVILILVKQINHGNYIKNKIKEISGENVEFVTGNMSGKSREKAIFDLKNKNVKGMIATSLADEGLDVPILDVAILAGGGSSSSRVNQRIGRTLRKSLDNKSKSIVIIYDHKNARYLKEHTKKIKKIIKKETEFEVINSNQNTIINDISKFCL